MPTRITLGSLRALGACEEGLSDFRSTFPRGLTVKPGARLTPRMAERLASLARHFDWFAEYDRATAWAEYDRVRATARAEYDRVRATAEAEYDRATAEAEYDRATAEAEYVRATAPARAEYVRATAPARAEYDRVRAGALWRALGGA